MNTCLESSWTPHPLWKLAPISLYCPNQGPAMTMWTWSPQQTSAFTMILFQCVRGTCQKEMITQACHWSHGVVLLVTASPLWANDYRASWDGTLMVGWFMHPFFGILASDALSLAFLQQKRWEIMGRKALSWETLSKPLNNWLPSIKWETFASLPTMQGCYEDQIESCAWMCFVSWKMLSKCEEPLYSHFYPVSVPVGV